jgi:hypothetical protein
MGPGIFFLMFLLTVAAGSGQQFERLHSKQTGITFGNYITENDSFNIINDFYAYNGGGVAVGDLDGDGRPDIWFTGTGVRQRIYRNLGGMQFADVTTESGVVDSGLASGILFADLTGDGALDVYIAKRYEPNRFYVNDGKGRFTERSREYGLDVNAHTTHAAVLDYDGDGDLDLYIVTNGEPRRQGHVNPGLSDILLRNDGGRFVDVSAQAGIADRGYGLSASVGDLNNDGWPDIYVANDFEERDKMYINQGDGTFKDVATEAMRQMSQFSMGSDIADVNNDGLMDVMTVDMLPPDHWRRMTQVGGMSLYGPFFDSVQRVHNSLQLNRGGGYFSDICFYAGVAATDWSWAVLMSDFDHDGLTDIFIGNGTKRDLGDQDYNYSVQPSAERSADAYKLIPRSWVPNAMFRNRNGLQFDTVSNAWGLGDSLVTNGAAMADLDGDGDLDLVLNTTDTTAVVYRNMAVERRTGNSIVVQLADRQPNSQAIGSRIVVHAGGRSWTREMYGARGFLSTSQYVVHVGLGNIATIDSIVVRWPDRTQSVHTGIAVNTTATIQKGATEPWVAPASAQPLFVDASNRLPATHRENIYDDFKRERLLPYRFSRKGPGTAVGDINGDGLADIIVGGAKYMITQAYVQRRDGTFVQAAAGLDDMPDAEDVAMALVDVNGDGHLDLIVVTGGNEFDPDDDELVDRLYRNNGKGVFTLDAKALPNHKESGGCIAVADIDGDKRPDIFIGNRVVPGRFPILPKSRLYRNVGGSYIDVSATNAPMLDTLGMVTAATFVDIDGDGDQDLVVVGEWMSPRILLNHRGTFTDATQSFGLESFKGLWQSVVAADVDGDGAVDLVCGNLGLNSRHPTSAVSPIEYVAGDFDDNGSIDPIFSYVIEGVRRPMRDRQTFLGQMPTMARRFVTFRAFSLATPEDIIPTDYSGPLFRGSATTFATTLFRRKGATVFVADTLPEAAQYGPVTAIHVADVDGDSHADILLAGNSREPDNDATTYQAGIGVMLRGSAAGRFSAVRADSSGWIIPEITRCITPFVDAQGTPTLFIGVNNGAQRLFVPSRQRNH